VKKSSLISILSHRPAKGQERKRPVTRTIDLRPETSDLGGNAFGFAGSERRREDSATLNNEVYLDVLWSDEGPACQSIGRENPAQRGTDRRFSAAASQMMDQCTDLFEVEGFVDEAVNPEINGLLEKGVSPL
jgi:hypothetical protein